MTHRRTRLLATSGATLALVLAATAGVAARPGDDDMPGLGGGSGLHMGGGPGAFAGMDGSFVRQEITWETSDGVVTRRLDNGVVTSATETSVEYTIAGGETASATVDADTQLLSVSATADQVGRRHRSRMSTEEIAVTDLVAGSEIQVLAESQADGTFLAQRIVLLPAEAADSTDDSATTDGAAASPAPAASTVPLESPADA